MTFRTKTQQSMVKIHVDGTLPLESRLDLMSAAFVGIVNKWRLIEILTWNLVTGCAEFIVDGRPVDVGQANVVITSEPL